MSRTPGERAMCLGCIGGGVRVLWSALKLVVTSFCSIFVNKLTYLLRILSNDSKLKRATRGGRQRAAGRAARASVLASGGRGKR